MGKFDPGGKVLFKMDKGKKKRERDWEWKLLAENIQRERILPTKKSTLYSNNNNLGSERDRERENNEKFCWIVFQWNNTFDM